MLSRVVKTKTRIGYPITHMRVLVPCCAKQHGVVKKEGHKVVEVVAKQIDFVTTPTYTSLKPNERRNGRYIAESETNNCNVVIQSSEKLRCFTSNLQVKPVI